MIVDFIKNKGIEMKKIVKISLGLAMALASTQNACADSLASAFQNGKVSGEIKSQYFQKENQSGDESSIWTNGGNLSLTTGSFYGLTAGVTFQTGHVANIDYDNAITASNYSGDMDASGSVMSEAYLAYSLSNTTLKAGRQYISTPLVAGSGSRMFKQSFEGIVLVNTDLANTTLLAAYVDKFQGRTDGNGNEPEFEQVEDGAYTVYAKNTSIDNLELQAQYAQIKALAGNDTKAIYVEADYKINNITLAGQVYNTDDGSSTNSDGTLYGVKAVADIVGFTATAAYTTTDDEADVVYGLGDGADYSFTASPIYGGNYSKDTNSYLIGLGYKFPIGLGLDTSYTSWDDNFSNIKTSESNVTASYEFDKNLSTKIMYSKFDSDSSYDYRTRVYVSYKF
jgi:imipenem/basic amino acid-specific outer membrane pore